MAPDGDIAYLSTQNQGLIRVNLLDSAEITVLSSIRLRNLKLYNGSLFGINGRTLFALDTTEFDSAFVINRYINTYNISNELCFTSSYDVEVVDQWQTYEYADFNITSIDNIRSPHYRFGISYDSHTPRIFVWYPIMYSIGNYVYSTHGGSKQVVLWDIHNLDSARYLGPRNFRSTLVLGEFDNHLVTIDSQLGIQLFSLNDPEQPALRISSDSLAIQYASISGSHAYLARPDSALEIWSLSLRNRPRCLGRVTFRKPIQAIAVHDSYGLVVTSDNHLHTVDISDPTRPVEFSELGGSGTIVRVRKFGDRVYVVEDSLGLIIMDSRSIPEFDSLGLYSLAHISDVYVDRDRVYISAGSAIHILDVSNPARPEVLRIIPRERQALVNALSVSQGILYISSSEGIAVYDARDLNAIAFRSLLTNAPASELQISEGRLYAISANKLVAFHLNNGLNPRPLIEYVGPDDNFARNLTIVGSLAFLQRYRQGESTPYSFDVIDISDNDSLHYLGTLQNPGLLTGMGAMFPCNELLGVFYGDVLSLFDFSAFPESFRKVADFSMGNEMVFSAIRYQDCLIASTRGSLLIFDATPLEVNPAPHTLNPYTCSLGPAFPNPFNSSTTIRFSTGSRAAPTRLAVYGIDGRLVKEFDEKWKMENGTEHSVVWDAGELPGGIYLIRLESGAETRTVKAVLIK
jgi:hypothetical protein